MEFDKVNPQEIIDKLDQLILYFERKKRFSSDNEEKHPTPHVDRN